MHLPTTSKLANAIVLVIFLFQSAAIGATNPFQHSIASAEQYKQHLHVTAVRNSASYPYDSYLQCLRLPEAFHGYPTVGASVILSAVSNATMVVLPPHSEEGWHRPPAPMWFFLLRGTARVATPSTGHDVWIEPPSAGKRRQHWQSTLKGGDEVVDKNRKVTVERQAVLALDVQGKGHLTFYPGEEETVALQMPLGEDWKEWLESLQVVANGPC